MAITSTYFYFLLVTDKECIPLVYNPLHIFTSLLPLCSRLLQENDYAAILKGIGLFRCLVDKLDPGELSESTVNSPGHFDIFRYLEPILTYCNYERCRREALECLRIWLVKFDVNTKNRFIKFALSICVSSGVRSFLIHELKEMVRKNRELYPYRSLREMSILACRLPQGRNTDILENKEAILGALNFIIYLFLSDHTNELKDLAGLLKKEFLIPVEHLMVECHGVYQKLMCREKSSSSDIEFSCNILPEHEGISREQEIENLELGANSVDLIRCVWNEAISAVNRYEVR